MVVVVTIAAVLVSVAVTILAIRHVLARASSFPHPPYVVVESIEVIVGIIFALWVLSFVYNNI